MTLGKNGPRCAWSRRNEYKFEWKGIHKGSSGSSHNKGDLVSFQGMMEILSPFGACLSNSFIAFFFLLMMPQMALGMFSVIGPAGPIEASLGGEATLSCYLSPPLSAQHMEVVWLQSTKVVHLYRDGEDQFEDQASDYRGRTELVRDAITSGNITLKILDVRRLDAGMYMCLIADGFHQEQADVELKVLGDDPEYMIKLPMSFISTGVCSFLISLSALIFLPDLPVYLPRSVPGLYEINWILTVSFAFEVEVILFSLWVQHRCLGYFYEWNYTYDWIPVGLSLLKCVSVYLLRRFVITHSQSPDLTIR
ncbi:uncharacterized protein [Notamacropus eugenii]|uniref:uncharacterized protein isoform X2 n=1 Tax=Notamacropus eugenii TaxID=9315 RepID=UPI003B67B347